ncbi:hypothetical protein AAQ05_005732 [Salmonella enterica subsp. diarizonae]|nr:hypothetical protein [Salmonella enterica subsp. diarizonae]
MLKKIPFFKKAGYGTKNLPLLIFNWLVAVIQVICIVVLLACTFVVVLNNIGGHAGGSLDILSKSK